MTIQKITALALLIAAVHFVLTSIAAHYVAVQVGSQVGVVVAKSLAGPMEHDVKDPDAEATGAYQTMKHESEAIVRPWKPFLAVLSFPARSFLRPLESQIFRSRINARLAHEISPERLRVEGTVLDLGFNLANSLILGLLVFLGLVAFRRNRAP